MTRLEPSDLDAALAELPGVHRAGAGRLEVHVKAPTFADAVTLVTDVAAVAEEMNHHPDVDLRYDHVAFILSTHSAGGVTQLDVDLGRRIVTLATELGAEVLPPRSRVEIGIDAVDPAGVLPFWKAGLGYVERRNADGETELHDPHGHGPVVWFQLMDPPRTERNRVHLDVHVPGGRQACEQRLEETLAAGGKLVTDRFAPDWWVLSDAEGNELCICLA